MNSKSPGSDGHFSDKELNEALRAWKVPAPDESVRERAWYRAKMALANRGSEEPAKDGQSLWKRIWQPAPLMAGLVLGCLLMWMAPWRGTAGDSESDRKLLVQLREVFSGQLQAAVIYPDRKMDLVVNPDAAPSASQPLVLEVSGGGRSVKILTFSGSRLQVDEFPALGDVEVLSTEDGGVLLLGKNSVRELPPLKVCHFEDGVSIRTEAL